MLKYLEFVFTLILITGIFLLIAGLAGHHGHFSFRPGKAGDWFMVLTPMVGLIGLITLGLRKTRLESSAFKAEIKETEEFVALIDRLDQAMALIKQRSSQPANAGRTQDFHYRLEQSIGKLKDMELEEVENLWTWFAPKGDWDSVTGAEGAELGNDIFMLTEKIRSQM